MKTITLKVHDRDHARITSLAKSQRRSMASLILHCVDAWESSHAAQTKPMAVAQTKPAPQPAKKLVAKAEHIPLAIQHPGEFTDEYLRVLVAAYPDKFPAGFLDQLDADLEGITFEGD